MALRAQGASVLGGGTGYPFKSLSRCFRWHTSYSELVAYAIAIVRSTKTLQRSEALCGANDVALPQGLAPLELAAFFSGL